MTTFPRLLTLSSEPPPPHGLLHDLRAGLQVLVLDFLKFVLNSSPWGTSQVASQITAPMFQKTQKLPISLPISPEGFLHSLQDPTVSSYQLGATLSTSPSLVFWLHWLTSSSDHNVSLSTFRVFLFLSFFLLGVSSSQWGIHGPPHTYLIIFWLTYPNNLSIIHCLQYIIYCLMSNVTKISSIKKIISFPISSLLGPQQVRICLATR